MRLYARCGAVIVVATALAWSIPARAGRASDVRMEAFRLLNEGSAAINRGDYPLAVEKLRRAASMALNSFRTHYYLGVALIGDRRYADALEPLALAVELDGTQVQAHVAIGDAHLKLGNLDEASASYNRALKLRAEYPEALDGLARLEEARADDKAAEDLYRRALANNRGFAPAAMNLGDLLMRHGRLDEALQLLMEAVSSRPDYAPGMNRLALAFGKLGMKNEAVATIRRAITLEPKSAAHQASLGRVLLDMGLTGGAEAALNAAIALDPGLPEARAGMAELRRRQGDYAAAIVQLEATLADERTDARTRREFQEKIVSLGQERDRAAQLQARVANGEATADELRQAAAIAASRGMWAEAADYQSRSEPADAERERLAFYLLRAGRYREAHDIWSNLASTSPRADLAVNDGVALAQVGDHAGAVAAFQRALERQDAPGYARAFLGNALWRLGRRDEAIAEYTRYLKDAENGEIAERVRRILMRVAPETLPKTYAPPPYVLPPTPTTPEGGTR